MQKPRVTLLEQALLTQLAETKADIAQKAQIAKTKADIAQKEATLTQMTPEELKQKFYSYLEKLEEILDNVIVLGVKSKEIEHIGDFSHMLANMCEGCWKSHQNPTGD